MDQSDAECAFASEIPECVLDDRAEADALVPEQSRRQFGVEHRGGLQVEFAQRRQILARRVQHPLLVADRGLQRAEVADRRRVEEEDTCAAAEHLDEVGALRIAESRGPLDVHRDRPLACGDLGRGGDETVRILDDDVINHAVDLRVPSIATPSEPGGSPASMHTSSAHASTCGAIGPCGDHDARSSIWAPSPSAASDPNPFEIVLVAVPEAEWNVARRDARASISHDHATSASIGSTPMSVSSGAWAKHTIRHGPFQGPGSAGSWSRMKRPVP